MTNGNDPVYPLNGYTNTGMTKREEMASRIAAGLISGDKGFGKNSEEIADYTVKITAALISALNAADATADAIGRSKAEGPVDDAGQRVLGHVLDLIQGDPHLWSKRPCPTCRTISEICGKPFGCTARALAVDIKKQG